MASLSARGSLFGIFVRLVLTIVSHFALGHSEQAGCDVSRCAFDAQTSRMQCDVHDLLSQQSDTRKLHAATTDLRHPVQTYLLEASPWPAEYRSLAWPKTSSPVRRWVPDLDYCYRVDRLQGYDTDLMGLLVVPPNCSDASAIQSRGFVLAYRSAFISLSGVGAISLHVFDCASHTLFGGCNENSPLTAKMLAGVEDAVVVERAVAIMTRWGDTYYHWLLEELPRLMYVRDELEADPNLMVLMHDHRSNRQLLAMLGVGSHRIVALNATRMYFVRELLVPPVAHCGRPAISAVRAMRVTLRSFLIAGGSLPPAPRHVVVVQRGGQVRATINQAELMARLRLAFPDLVFVQYGPDFVSINDTARIFGAARGVIGVHGAGLSNLLFAPATAFLIEFHQHGSNHVRHPNICHQGTAAALGMRHMMLWLQVGKFDGGVIIPVAAAVRAVCRFEGGPARTCGTSILQMEQAQGRAQPFPAPPPPSLP